MKNYVRVNQIQAVSLMVRAAAVIELKYKLLIFAYKVGCISFLYLFISLFVVIAL